MSPVDASERTATARKPSAESNATPTVLVFDLGGVLFDFQGAALIARHSRRHLVPEAARQSWVPLVRSFETDACSETEFAELAVRTYELRGVSEARAACTEWGLLAEE